MATFTGTLEDFNRFIMPRIRNRVQSATKPIKQRAQGRCERCGTKCELEAAHVHGKERKEIVANVLEKYQVNGLYEIESLSKLESEIMQAHEPIGECFIFLCRQCHRLYDSDQGNLIAYKRSIGKETKRSSQSANGQSVGFYTREKHPHTYQHLEKAFYNALIDEYSANTAYSYKQALTRICKREGCRWEDLPETIDGLIRDYSANGPKAELGKKSHNTNINALRAFAKFWAKKDFNPMHTKDR